MNTFQFNCLLVYSICLIFQAASIDSDADLYDVSTDEYDTDVIEIPPPSPKAVTVAPTVSVVRKSRPKKPAFNPRQQEVDEFFDKLKKAVSKLDQATSIEFDNQQVEKLLGEGIHLIVFDCNRPSYMDLRRKTNIKLTEVIENLKSRASCSPDDNMWLDMADSHSPITYNHKTKSLTQPALPFRDLTAYFIRLDLCDDFMKFLRHPGYYIRSYRKPSVCLAKKKSRTHASSHHEQMDVELDENNARASVPVLPKQNPVKHFPRRPRFRQHHHQRRPFPIQNHFQQQPQHQQFHPGAFQFGGLRPMGGCFGG